MTTHEQACLLENLRFHAGEVGNDPKFTQQLAALADVYVNDAFAVCHRQQSSVTVRAQPGSRVLGVEARSGCSQRVAILTASYVTYGGV